MLEIINIDINKLKPYKNNPRKNDEAVEYVANSIKEFGFKVPIIVDKDYEIIAGHTRLKAAQQLGLKEVPIIIADDLTEEQVKAFRLADNKVSEIAEWDFELLNDELKDILNIDMGNLGFDLFEEEQEVVEDDYEIEVPEEPKAKLGDIYQLGNHRLMCGDSTSKDDVEKLMNGNKADMVFTDPPYNVNAESRSKKNGIDKIKNDNLEDEEFELFINGVFKNLYNYTKDDGAFYIFHNYRCQYVFEKYLKENDFEIKNQIIWVKDIPAYTTNLYRQQHENCFLARKKNKEYIIKQIFTPIFYCNKNSYTVTLEEGHDTSVWNVPSIQSAKSVDEYGNKWFKGGAKNLNLHVTQKPIMLSAKAIRYNSEQEDVVLDLFGGSGATMISCEQMKRKCYMMEYDLKYVDVIINRWETFTGQKAVLLNGEE